jgi:hypothetical protein
MGHILQARYEKSLLLIKRNVQNAIQIFLTSTFAAVSVLGAGTGHMEVRQVCHNFRPLQQRFSPPKSAGGKILGNCH